jgi:hypothetical protein
MGSHGRWSTARRAADADRIYGVSSDVQSRLRGLFWRHWCVVGQSAPVVGPLCQFRPSESSTTVRRPVMNMRVQIVVAWSSAGNGCIVRGRLSMLLIAVQSVGIK